MFEFENINFEYFCGRCQSRELILLKIRSYDIQRKEVKCLSQIAQSFGKYSIPNTEHIDLDHLSFYSKRIFYFKVKIHRTIPINYSQENLTAFTNEKQARRKLFAIKKQGFLNSF